MPPRWFGTSRSIRTTVHLLTTLPWACTVLFRTFVTKSDALSPPSNAVISHGPLMGEPEKVSTTLPLLSSTSRQPAFTVFDVPSVVGTLPTITQPLCSTLSAVVRPTPPGQDPVRWFASICAKRLTEPPGEI